MLPKQLIVERGVEVAASFTSVHEWNLSGSERQKHYLQLVFLMVKTLRYNFEETLPTESIYNITELLQRRGFDLVNIQGRTR